MARRLPTLVVDSSSILLANGTNVVLGFAFWTAAARLYPTGVVGTATTMVATASSVAAFANLGLGNVLERFLPRTGRDAVRVVVGSHALSVVLTLVAGLGFVLVDPVEGLLPGRAEQALFVAMVVVLGAFSLQDFELIALGASRRAAAANVAHAASKLAAVVGLATVGSAAAIVGSWLVTALVVSIVVFWTIVARRVPLLVVMGGQEPSVPPLRSVASFWALTLAWLLAGAVPGFVLPLIVARRLGFEEAAHYNAAWLIASAATTLMLMASSPFVATASRPDADLAARTREFLPFMALVGVVRAVAVGGGGAVALHVYGPSYARAATPLVLVLALVQLLSTPAYVYGALARVHRRILHPMFGQAIGSATVIVAADQWVGRGSITQIGVAYLVAEAVVFVWAVVPLVRLVRRSLATPSPSPSSGSGSADGDPQGA